MKAIVLILAIGFSFLSCEKDQNPGEEDPRIYNLNFELLRNDGSVYENGDIQISGNSFATNLTEIQNDQYSWLGLGKIETEETRRSDKILFGWPCGTPNCNSDYMSLEFASGAEGRNIGDNESWEQDKYWLLRYTNEDVDTLRIHDSRTNNPYTRTFTFFINEQPLEATNFIYDEYAITIQK